MWLRGRSSGLLDSLTTKQLCTPVSHLQQPVQQQQNYNSGQRQHQHGNPNVQVPAGFACRSRGAAGLGGRSHRLQRNLHTACRTDDGLGPVRLIPVWVDWLRGDLQGGSTGDPGDKLHRCCFCSNAAMKSSSAEGVMFPSHRTRSDQQVSSRKQLGHVQTSAMFEGQCDCTFKKVFVMFYADNVKINIHNEDKLKAVMCRMKETILFDSVIKSINLRS